MQTLSIRLNETLDLELLFHLQLNFSHLNEHKFRHNFKDTVSPVYFVVLEFKQRIITSCVDILFVRISSKEFLKPIMNSEI